METIITLNKNESLKPFGKCRCSAFHSVCKHEFVVLCVCYVPWVTALSNSVPACPTFNTLKQQTPSSDTAAFMLFLSRVMTTKL